MSDDTVDVDARLFHELHGRWPDGYTPPTANGEPPTKERTKRNRSEEDSSFTSFFRKPPPGFRWWRDSDAPPRWPTLGKDAWHGPIGDFLTLVGPETEASPAAVGIGALARYGLLLGHNVHVDVGEHRHYPNIYAVVIGETSVGAKGTADITNFPLFTVVYPNLERELTVGGFGSGEALVADIADRDGDATVKRRLIHEPEFSAVLRVGRRESSILSEIIRKGFDHFPIQHRTKTGGKVIASSHHLAVLGSTTPDELVALSAELDISNGWLNRFLLVWAEMPAPLPFGGAVDKVTRGGIADLLKPRVSTAHRYLVTKSSDLGAKWEAWYLKVRKGTGPTAMLRALTARQHALAPRLMAIYAASMGADRLTVEHFDAARAWTDYSVATAHALFGGRDEGDRGKLLAAIRAAGIEGLTTSQQHDVFQRNKPALSLDALRDQLVADQLVALYDTKTGGRMSHVAVAITPKGAP